MTSRRTHLALLVWLVAAVLTGCSSVSTGPASTSPASRTTGGASPPAPPATGAPRTAVAARASFHLARPLPAAGIAIEDHGSIRLLDLNGTEVGVITDASVEGLAEPPHHDLYVRDGVGRYRLSAGQLVPTAAPPAPPPPAQFGCHELAGPSGALLICNDSTNTAEPTISTVTVSGPRRVVGSPFPKVAGRWDGSWEWAQLSPNGRWVLAQWSGECEVPDAFLVAAAGGSPQTFDASPAAHPRQSVALGWSASGEAVVWLQPGGCGTGSPSPGVYRAQPGGSLHLIAAAQDTAAIVMWS